MTRFRLWLFAGLLAASCGLPELALAQPISTLTRATSTTGLNDSTLWSGLDSASRVRAFSLAQIRKGIALKSLDSVVTPLVSAGTGASKTLTFKTTTSGSVAKNTLVLGADSSATFLGAAGASGWSISPSGQLLSGATTTAIQIGNGTGGSIGFSALSGDTIGWLHKVTRGPAGNMFIQAGTGASRTLTLATTTSGSAVKNVLVLGADSSATFLGNIGDPTNWTLTRGGKFLTASVGAANGPAIQIGNGNGSTIGVWSPGGDTLGFATAGVRTLDVYGGATTSLRGGAGSFILQCGTGNSRTCAFQTTTSAGAVKNVLVLGADSSATFLGAVSMAGGTLAAAAGTFSGVVTSTLTSGVVFNAASATTGSISLTLMNSGNTTTLSLEDVSGGTFGQTAYATILRTSSARPLVLMTNNSGRLEISSAGAFDFKSNAVSAITTLAASGAVTFSDATAAGAGDVYACKGTNNVFHYGAACAASTAKIKDNIAPYSGGRRAVMRLAPSSFSYAKGYYGHRADLGLIADAVAVVDPRFAFYAAADQTLTNGKMLKKGEAYAINWPAVTTAMLSELQDLQRQVDSLKVKKP